ncbi:MAG: potassium/proton antiporter [Bacteroidales bacterium]|jgi:cell volume regulation protein A|nr:potassium/proton antiporter [Bacteroidales bacterium]
MDTRTEIILLTVSILFLVSLFVSKAGSRFGVPVLLLFLGVGMFFGSSGLGIQFDNYNMAQVVGSIALCIILFSGGLDTSYKDIKPIAAQGIVLATLGVLLTALFTGIFIYYAVNALFSSISISFLESMLLASVMSSTDSASVFAILRGKSVRLKNNLKPMLELESGSNDPMAYMLTLVLVQLIISGQHESVAYGQAVLNFFTQFAVGVSAGFFLGKAAVWLINKIKLDNDSFYPILLCTCGIFIFSITDLIKGNGFLAVYLAGLVIGNSKFAHKRLSLQFFDGLAWISQIALFLILGLLVNPIGFWSVASVSLLIGVFVIIGSRPLAVFLSLLPFRKTPVRDKVFVSWVGLKGAVPILFAIFPFVAGLPQDISLFIFNVVFCITLMSLMVQGVSLTWVAKFLRLSDESDKVEFKAFDVECDEEVKRIMKEVELTDEWLKNGNLLKNIALPEHTQIMMIKREDGRYLVPNENVVLTKNDKLMVITIDADGLL